MSSESTSKLPKHDQANSEAEAKTVDPLDLVRTDGYPANPQEALQNPALAPEMINAPGDLREDLMDED